MQYYNDKIENVLKRLKTTKDGLTEKEAAKRLQDYGENLIREGKKESLFHKFIKQFNDTMIIILLIVDVVMLIYGLLISHDYTDSIVITVVVFLNAMMGFIQERNAEVTLNGLKKYSANTVEVQRDNKIEIIDAKHIVPGDIIILNAGDKVPADARVIKSSNLLVDESPLTGESAPVAKVNHSIKGIRELQGQSNMIFNGSNITSGSVVAVVTQTGMTTELGKIAVSLNTPYRVETSLEKKIKEISKLITKIIVVVLILMFIYCLIKGYDTMQSIILCVSLAVAAIPEGLPAVITVSLANGVNELSKKKTVVKQIKSVETLGSVNIICSDKTGTITQNKMEIKESMLFNENMSDYVFALCNETIINEDDFIGDPTESCLYSYLITKGKNVLELRKKHKRIMDIPFDSDRKRMSTINEIDGKNYILVKGALNGILEKSKQIDEKGKIRKLNKKDIESINKKSEEMANNALRVMAFAYKELKTIPSKEKAIEEENDLILLGIVGIIDPPREDIKESIKLCKKAYIRPVMITGDSIETACAVAKEIGIVRGMDECILGSELDKYNDEELVEIVNTYSVYARVNPIHKERIVKAFQSENFVVGMTGDGVNDAPAIKDAHVGIGMGITGTEVTKSVADIILLDDSFSTIVRAIEEGRRIFTNIKNNIVYSLSSNIAEMFVVIIGLLTGNTILLPIHMLFIDLITDSIPSVALAFEESDKDSMSEAPRPVDKTIFTPFVKSCVITSGIIETIFTLVVYFAALKSFGQEVASTLALLTVVIQEIAYAISCRNLKRKISRKKLFSNKVMNYCLLLVILIEMIFFLTPVGKVIEIANVPLNIMLYVVIVNMFVFFIYEGVKPVLNKLFKD